MIISRWKVMAGILCVTIGGLAAIAGQSQGPDAPPSNPVVDLPVTAEAPKPIPATPPVPAPTLPKADLPAPPAVDPPAAVAIEPPAHLKTNPQSAVLPPSTEGSPSSPPIPYLPRPSGKPLEVPPPSLATSPEPVLVPVSGRVLPPATVPDRSPTPAAVPMDLPMTGALPTTPPATAAFEPPPVPPTAEPLVPPTTPAADPLLQPTRRAPALHTNATVTATVPATRFRIILRVGEGEPMFEVRHGDDLVMKVLCEKIDIKSPEKGQQGLSAVTATGKVRFVGFGAEGTCDAFSFLAGTGEVALSGNVKVQVKDKIGRVESELIADQMKYKLDASSMPGILKP